jgi:hypothetical protein
MLNDFVFGDKVAWCYLGMLKNDGRLSGSQARMLPPCACTGCWLGEGYIANSTVCLLTCLSNERTSEVAGQTSASSTISRELPSAYEALAQLPVFGRSGGIAGLHWGHSRIPPQFPDQTKAPELGKPLFINQMSIKLKQRILHETSGSRFCTVFARTMAYYDILALDLWLWGSVLQSSQSAAHALLLTGRHWWS